MQIKQCGSSKYRCNITFLCTDIIECYFSVYRILACLYVEDYNLTLNADYNVTSLCADNVESILAISR